MAGCGEVVGAFGWGNASPLARANRGLIPESFDRYRFEAWTPEQAARAEAVWQHFDLANPVLTRGMVCLLKSGMLGQHFQFLEASLAAVHVAMDAAHSLVLTELRKEGLGNPSSLDAGRWIEEALGYQPTGLRFLEDWYDDRIRNFHPDSRFGPEAIPFFCIDDVYDLTHFLKEIFYFLVVREAYGEPAKSWNIFDDDHVASPRPRALVSHTARQRVPVARQQVGCRIPLRPWFSL